MLTITDLFCGAGGSSSGAIQVPGVQVRMAANHWRLAVETHNTNHPGADHDCADISAADPRRYPRTDILWASPECTNHSQAKGRRRADATPDLFGQILPDAAAERSRATMWDVVRFAEHHTYRAIIVENVVDVRHWPLWHAWCAALHALGYVHRVVYLNSMFAQQMGAPAPQSRDRLYVVAWRPGDRAPDLSRWTRPRAWCPSCEAWISAVQAFKRPERAHGRYRAQYLYRCPRVACRNREVFPPVLPAAAAIDWSNPGTRIGDRARPLAAKTVARIRAGLARHGRPIHLEAAGHTYERRPGVRAWPVDEPLRTLHTTASKALACDPLMVELRNNGTARPTGHPLSTLCAAGNHHGLLVPVEGRDNVNARPAREPLRTQSARHETALLVPAGGTWNDAATPTDEPMRTRTTRDTDALCMPPGFVMRNNGSPGDGGEHCTPLGEPVRTITAKGHQSLVTWPWVGQPWVVVDYNGPARKVSEPLPTQTTIAGDALLGVEPEVEDCLFRMLEVAEIQAAMAFTDSYVVLGNKRERVRQLGNAVTPPAARDLIAAVAEALTGETIGIHPTGHPGRAA